MRFRLAALAVALVAFGTIPAAQSDLDALMARVLARRDQNWTKLQQYVLEEREALKVTGPAGASVYGFTAAYTWFPRDGFFIRSPRSKDGVTIGESERNEQEADWLRREQRRRRNPGEPRFVSAAYFLEFRFDPGQYALVGREQVLGRNALRIEYYPKTLFNQGRMRPNRELRERNPQVEQQMNKASVVTLWVDQELNQILQYQLENVDLDFLPARWFVRMEGMKALMRMNEPFPGVWLPHTINIEFDATTALGAVEAKYDVEYFDYKLAEVTTRIR